MAEMRLAAAEIELGLGSRRDDDLDAIPADDRPDTDLHPRGERRETLEAAIGQPIVDADPELETDAKP